jgi:hypothetical protein
MPALGAGIRVLRSRRNKTWMAGTSPAMTAESRSGKAKQRASLAAAVRLSTASAKSPSGES